jgi:hypothetical protein
LQASRRHEPRGATVRHVHWYDEAHSRPSAARPARHRRRCAQTLEGLPEHVAGSPSGCHHRCCVTREGWCHKRERVMASDQRTLDSARSRNHRVAGQRPDGVVSAHAGAIAAGGLGLVQATSARVITDSVDSPSCHAANPAEQVRGQEDQCRQSSTQTLSRYARDAKPRSQEHQHGSQRILRPSIEEPKITVTHASTAAPPNGAKPRASDLRSRLSVSIVSTRRFCGFPEASA